MNYDWGLGYGTFTGMKRMSLHNVGPALVARSGSSWEDVFEEGSSFPSKWTNFGGRPFVPLPSLWTTAKRPLGAVQPSGHLSICTTCTHNYSYLVINLPKAGVFLSFCLFQVSMIFLTTVSAVHYTTDEIWIAILIWFVNIASVMSEGSAITIYNFFFHLQNTRYSEISRLRQQNND